ncbi:hypothetical protein EVAR_50584_1 [Eumeta japonica]|uniref:Uncharacterized protein n=1 Tax=Eumeta variegata TaxID=151549 RepID=A0A4C1Y9B0_EUMVA|nr:hypothetical protein EVAR_50584_1 [Eumeta japonica]
MENLGPEPKGILGFRILQKAYDRVMKTELQKAPYTYGVDNGSKRAQRCVHFCHRTTSHGLSDNLVILSERQKRRETPINLQEHLLSKTTKTNNICLPNDVPVTVAARGSVRRTST